MASAHDDARASRQARTSHRARQSLPVDRFDNLPRTRRVGAHRISAKLRRFWLYVVAAAIGITLLTGIGIIVVQSFGGSITGLNQAPAQDAPAAPEAPPAVVDPAASVAVLNGSETDNLQFGLEQVIEANDWGDVAYSDYAASRDVEISAVFYVAPEDEAAAAGLAKELGGVSTYLGADYADLGVRLVVLLGADYAGPGFDEAEQYTQRTTSTEADAAPND